VPKAIKKQINLELGGSQTNKNFNVKETLHRIISVLGNYILSEYGYNNFQLFSFGFQLFGLLPTLLIASQIGGDSNTIKNIESLSKQATRLNLPTERIDNVLLKIKNRDFKNTDKLFGDALVVIFEVGNEYEKVLTRRAQGH
jgi:hypothetical protein